ncbi:MAG: hypothetical protein LKJ94_07260 [Candidatus Methanomethylophilus sp.]|nr:hypothetical protein [Methanomethylophilus sp.]MCI2075469.1 hypothetical protein [Methanomethylophilus sp.]MCI2093291.1 hypothetical protein [Methanomethylophilus sp.]
MTSEILLMNKNCAVLAADSAATLSSPHKVYECNKVFSLSEANPVGVMIYQNPLICNTPAETLIKEYRKRRAGEAWMPSLDDYADDFLGFLDKESSGRSGRRGLIKKDSIERDAQHQVRVVWASLVDEMSRMANEEIDKMLYSGKVEVLDTDSIFQEVAKRFKRYWERNVDPSAYGKNLRGLRRICGGRFADTLSDGLGLTEPERHLEEVLDITALMISSDKPLDSTTGMIFAGFGRDDVFPAYRECCVDGRFFNGIKTKTVNAERITEDSRSMIRTFAQNDVSNTFLNGIDPEVFNVIFDSFEVLLNDTTMAFAENEIKEGKTSAKAIEAANRKALKKLSSSTQSKIMREYYDPVEGAVSFMSKAEMAQMAESLINITSLRRHVSVYGDESVGGPVDVAVISRGEGLIWIKRKHYFDIALNPQFIKRT